MSSKKAELIKEMIAMQKKFSTYDHANGVDPKDFYLPAAGSELDGFVDKFQDLANQVVDIAHGEAGSER